VERGIVTGNGAYSSETGETTAEKRSERGGGRGQNQSFYF
jgi:hypothetical protein